MKKVFLTLLAVLPLTAFAQKPILGIQAGATYSNIRGNEVADEYKYDINFLVGISLEVPLSEKISFVTNVNYERKTSKTDILMDVFTPDLDPIFEPEYREATGRVTLHYISIPMDIRYYFGAKKNIYINSGPTVGFFIDDVFTIDGDKIEDEYRGESDLKAIDFGLNLGIGMKFPLGKKTFYTELRDNLGLINIADAPSTNNSTLKTNSFNVIVGFEF